MEFQDRVLQCVECRQDFTFTAGEQEFYERKGFKEIPKRCKPCREARKTRRADDGGVSSVSPMAHGQPEGMERQAREMYDATCASCGAQARVPFKPAAGRPVYCRDCYTARQNQGSSL